MVPSSCRPSRKYRRHVDPSRPVPTNGDVPIDGITRVVWVGWDVCSGFPADEIGLESLGELDRGGRVSTERKTPCGERRRASDCLDHSATGCCAVWLQISGHRSRTRLFGSGPERISAGEPSNENHLITSAVVPRTRRLVGQPAPWRSPNTIPIQPTSRSVSLEEGHRS